MQDIQTDAAREMKALLRSDLRTAMKDKHHSEVEVLRTLIARLDNAEAPSILTTQTESNPSHALRGSAEVERLLLSNSEVHQLLRAEIEERETAAAEMERLGRSDHAENLRASARLVTRYLVCYEEG